MFKIIQTSAIYNYMEFIVIKRHYLYHTNPQSSE